MVTMTVTASQTENRAQAVDTFESRFFCGIGTVITCVPSACSGRPQHKQLCVAHNDFVHGTPVKQQESSIRLQTSTVDLVVCEVADLEGRKRMPRDMFTASSRA